MDAGLLSAATKKTVVQLRADLKGWGVFPPRNVNKAELVVQWMTEAQQRGLGAADVPHSVRPCKRRGSSRSRSPRRRRIVLVEHESPAAHRVVRVSPKKARLEAVRVAQAPRPAPPVIAPSPKRQREEDEQVEEHHAEKRGSLLLPALGLTASVGLLTALAYVGVPTHQPPDEMALFAEALAAQAAAHICDHAPTAALHIPEVLKNRTFPDFIRVLPGGDLAEISQFSLPLLCSARLALVAAVPYVGAAAVAAVAIWMWIRRRQAEAETIQFAQQIANYAVERLQFAQGEPVFIDDVKLDAMAAQTHLTEAQRQQVWALAAKVVQANPRVLAGQALRQGEMCTTWRIA